VVLDDFFFVNGRDTNKNERKILRVSGVGFFCDRDDHMSTTERIGSS